MSGRTIIHGKTTGNAIVPIQCNADGTLEMTAEISSAGLATEAKQDAIIADLTDGTQLARCMGSEDPNDPAGTQKQLHLDGSGNVQANVVNTINVAPSNTTNSGITDDPANSVAVGIRGRTDIADASTETFVLTDANGHLQVDVLSGAGGGDATAANQTLQLAQETIIAGDTTSIDNKINQGYDATIASGGSGLQQILCYGLDNSGDLDALRVDNSGHLEITIDDFVKGQDTMANSFPVVISSDQSDVATSSAQLPASLGQKANSGSLSICRSTTTGAFDLSARTTIATAGTSTKLLCDSNGVLQQQGLRDASTTAVSTTAVGANGTFTSFVLDLQ